MFIGSTVNLVIGTPSLLMEQNSNQAKRIEEQHAVVVLLHSPYSDGTILSGGGGREGLDIRITGEKWLSEINYCFDICNFHPERK